MASGSNHPEYDFSCTRWSMVQRLQAPQPEQARQALTELAQRYWYPVYAYVRRCGHAPDIAQDLARSFFAAIGGTMHAADVAPSGRFRDWLLAQLNAFLAGDWHDLTEGAPPVAAPVVEDLERRHREDRAGADSPAQAFQRGYALEVLAHAFKALQDEARQTGHLDMHDLLQPYLARDPLPGQFEEMAQKLRVRPLALVLALKRLRQRFRELVRLELSDAVASPEDMAAEQQTLFATLVGGL